MIRLLREINLDSRSPYILAGGALALALLAFAAGQWVFNASETSAEEPLPEQDSFVAGATATSETSDVTQPDTTLPPDVNGSSARGLTSAERGLDDFCADPVELSPPASDLASVVADSPEATCFVLQPGEYHFSNVVPKDWMTFLGTSRSEVTVRGSDNTENAFHGTATGVTIGRMTLTGFQGDEGQHLQEQSPIRGTSALWKSDRGEMAVDWLIEDIESSDNVASGIFLGDHFTVRGSTFRDNGVTGLGGSEMLGGLIEGNIVTGNGANQAEGVLVNGGGMKFTEGNSPEDPLVIRGNEVFSNAAPNGIWFDVGADGFHIIDNYIHDETNRPITTELSSNGVIRGNIIENTNDWSDYDRDWNAGAITIAESSDILVEDNWIDGASSGVVIRQTRRPINEQENFLTTNYDYVVFNTSRVTVRNNVMQNIDAVGVSTGVTGDGLIDDPSTIIFEGNIYADPGSVAFWWAGRNRYNWADWQASGRDAGGGTTVPAQPDWSLATRSNEPADPPATE